jgi:hypothetical protein
MIMDLNKNITDMLPSYVNNTLDEASRRRLENLMQSSPSLRAEVSWLRQVREHVQSDKAQRQQPAADAGLDRLMTLIAAEKSGKVSSIAPLSSLSKRVTTWYKPALAIAATVMFAQAIGLFMLLGNGSGADTIRSLSGGVASHYGSQHGSVLQVTFNSAVTEAQMRASLTSVGGEIVAGPGALGVYSIRVQKGSGADAANKLMQQKNVIDTATVVHD